MNNAIEMNNATEMNNAARAASPALAERMVRVPVGSLGDSLSQSHLIPFGLSPAETWSLFFTSLREEDAVTPSLRASLRRWQDEIAEAARLVQQGQLREGALIAGRVAQKAHDAGFGAEECCAWLIQARAASLIPGTEDTAVYTLFFHALIAAGQESGARAAGRVWSITTFHLMAEQFIQSGHYRAAAQEYRRAIWACFKLPDWEAAWPLMVQLAKAASLGGHQAETNCDLRFYEGECQRAGFGEMAGRINLLRQEMRKMPVPPGDKPTLMAKRRHPVRRE